MYYEEKIINGILCFRGTPNGEWREMSLARLTSMVQKNKETIQVLKEALRETKEALEDKGYKIYSNAINGILESV